MPLNLMFHENAQFHIRLTANYLVNSCVCVAVRLRSRTMNPFDFISTNRWVDFLVVRDATLHKRTTARLQGKKNECEKLYNVQQIAQYIWY